MTTWDLNLKNWRRVCRVLKAVTSMCNTASLTINVATIPIPRQFSFSYKCFCRRKSGKQCQTICGLASRPWNFWDKWWCQKRQTEQSASWEFPFFTRQHYNEKRCPESRWYKLWKYVHIYIQKTVLTTYICNYLCKI